MLSVGSDSGAFRAHPIQHSNFPSDVHQLAPLVRLVITIDGNAFTNASHCIHSSLVPYFIPGREANNVDRQGLSTTVAVAVDHAPLMACFRRSWEHPGCFTTPSIFSITSAWWSASVLGTPCAYRRWRAGCFLWSILSSASIPSSGRIIRSLRLGPTNAYVLSISAHRSPKLALLEA